MITDAHRKFARDMVALARASGMNNLRLEFDTSSSQTFLRDRDQYQHSKVVLVWSEGRHGAKTNIELFTTSTQNISEKLEPNE